jgi:hypothetical protein
VIDRIEVLRNNEVNRKSSNENIENSFLKLPEGELEKAIIVWHDEGNKKTYGSISQICHQFRKPDSELCMLKYSARSRIDFGSLTQ